MNTCFLSPLTAAIVALSSLFISTAGAAEEPGATTTDTSAALDHLLTSMFDANAPGAAVLVVRNGTAILRKGYGMADLELQVPMDPLDVFPICSVTKEFTAAAILQLAEAGKLNLSDSIAQYAPDYPTGGARVTLAQLLSHTSGIPSTEQQPEWRKTWLQDLTVAQVLDFTRGKPQEFAPGTDWKYSNTGYILLGRVIEQASGQTYADYVRTHLFGPAGMGHSVYPAGGRLVPRRVRGYSWEGKAWTNSPFLNPTQTYSAGALLMTVDDLWAWEQALQSGRIINAASWATALQETRLPDGRLTHYGYGFELKPLAGHGMIGHTGGMPGFCAFAARFPDAGVYIAILCNTDHPPMDLRAVAAKILGVVQGESGQPAAAQPVLTAAALDGYVGDYRIASDANFRVTMQNDALYGQLGPGRRKLQAVAPDEFTADGMMHFRFVRGLSHAVERVEVVTDGAGPELAWPRLNPPAETAPPVGKALPATQPKATEP